MIPPRIASFLLLATLTATAQQHLEVPRSDGHQTPLLIYSPSTPAKTCAPLALISHGAGGSEDGYRYLANIMTSLGYTAVVMGHRESGREALMSDVAKAGPLAGLQTLLGDPAAEGDRLLDVQAAVDWSNKTCKPTSRILLGHSMGAETVLLEAGARNKLGITAANAPHFDAYIALSPEGPGVVFPTDAWSSIRKPVLVLTGTLDENLNGGQHDRQIAWHNLPGLPTHCQWQGVIDGATHMNFGGRGPGHERVEPMVNTTLTSFLQGVHSGACKLPPLLPGMDLQAK